MLYLNGRAKLKGKKVFYVQKGLLSLTIPPLLWKHLLAASQWLCVHRGRSSTQAGKDPFVFSS